MSGVHDVSRGGPRRGSAWSSTILGSRWEEANREDMSAVGMVQESVGTWMRRLTMQEVWSRA